MRMTHIPEAEMMDEMARVFTANEDDRGNHVCDRAGIKPRTGRENVWTLFNDIRTSQTAPGVSRVVEARIVLLENCIEICSPIVHGTGRFLRAGTDARLIAQELASSPDGPAVVHRMDVHRPHTHTPWFVDVVRIPGTAPFIRIHATNVRQLRELLESLLGIHANAELRRPAEPIDLLE